MHAVFSEAGLVSVLDAVSQVVCVTSQFKKVVTSEWGPCQHGCCLKFLLQGELCFVKFTFLVLTQMCSQHFPAFTAVLPCGGLSACPVGLLSACPVGAFVSLTCGGFCQPPLQVRIAYVASKSQCFERFALTALAEKHHVQVSSDAVLCTPP